MIPLHKRIALLLALILVSVWLTGCSQGQATEPPTIQATVQPTAPPTVQPTAPPTAQPTLQPITQPTTQPTAPPTAQPTLQPITQPTTQPTLQPTTQPAENTPVAPEIFEPAATAGDLAARLQGLDLDEFFKVSWRELMLRDPESVLSEGLAETYHLQGAQLTDISDAYQRESQQMYAVVLETLHTYDRAALTPEQLVSCDVYEWYLDDRLRKKEFMYYDYPATYFPVTAVHEQLIQFFTDLHPIADKQDAQDYVTRLGQVNTKFEQLIEGLELREQAGIVPPRFAIQWAAYGVHNLASASATRTPFYQTLEEKMGALPDISEAEKESLLKAAEEAINESVLPAFQALSNYLQQQESIAPTDDGLWQFPNGEAYYAYLLRHYTTTDMTADEIHQLGLTELERIHAEMRAIFDGLGYPQDESLADLFNRVAEDGGYIAGHQVTESYEALIEQANQNLDGVFDIRPQAQIIVVESPIRGMYVSASLDGSRPGAFHAGPGNASETWYTMPTLAYHEAVPGHHFQISLAQESDLPTFRNMVTFLGYTEGWALYAEQLVWELGWYADDPYGNLGRLQAEAFRAARLVIDTGLHTRGWTFAQAEQFFIENVGYDTGDSVEPRIEIARYIVWPGQSTAYKIGMLKILELRQRAMDELGDQFDLQAFHNVVLRNGSMPLQVLERVVDDYIAAAQTAASP